MCVIRWREWKQNNRELFENQSISRRAAHGSMRKSSELEHSGCQGVGSSALSPAKPPTSQTLGLVYVVPEDEAHDMELERWAESMNK